MKYLLPLVLLIACGNPKQDIVRQIQAEKDSLKQYELRASELKLEITRSFRKASEVSLDEIKKTGGSKEMAALRDEAFEIDMKKIRSKSVIDSLETELKAY